MRNPAEAANPPVTHGILAPLFSRPLLVMALVLAVLPLALSVTLVMPVGPMFWDHYLYLDAAKRIAGGQIPAVDFFAPAGALGYYLFAGLQYLFPHGSPLMVSAWSLMIVTAPLMAVVVWQVQKTSLALAYGLVIPFLLFSLLPFNTGDFYPYPGSDAFGIYNRQDCQILYVLAAALVFVRSQRVLSVLVCLTMLSLLFLKVTGLVAGVILCVMAVAAGRLAFRTAIAAGLMFFAIVGLLELSTGIVSAYAQDMLSLLSVNTTSLVPRLMQSASMNFGLVCVALGLCLVLLVTEFSAVSDKASAFLRHPRLEAFTALADQPFLWLGSFILAGLLFESQNTGSQSFIFVWPVVLSILLEAYRRHGPSRAFATIAALVLAIALPPAVTIVQKAARAWVGAVQNVTIESKNLKTLGAVSARDFFAARAQRMEQIYAAQHSGYEAMTTAGELPSFLLFSDFDFQVLWLQTTDQAVSALHAYEADHGVRFETMMTIDFPNLFPWLMDRQAPKYIAIGADPFRAVPTPDARVAAAVGAVDIALYPTCPSTTTRSALLAIYAPLLSATHTRVPLTSCFDAFIRNDLIRQP